jgi:hypothetical protein
MGADGHIYIYDADEVDKRNLKNLLFRFHHVYERKIFNKRVYTRYWDTDGRGSSKPEPEYGEFVCKICIKNDDERKYYADYGLPGSEYPKYCLNHKNSRMVKIDREECEEKFEKESEERDDKLIPKLNDCKIDTWEVWT